MAAGGHRGPGSLQLVEASLDPGPQLADRRRGFALGRAAREHDLDPPGLVDGHADPAGSLRTPDAVGDVIRFHDAKGYGPKPTMPRFPDLTEPLSDDRVSLRLSAERDIPEILIAYQDDPRMHRDMGERRPPSGAELGRREERAAAERAAGTYVGLTVLEPGSDVCVGQIYVHDLDWNNARAELGMWLAPQARGRGLAGRALRLASEWLLESCGLGRLEILTEPDNQAMIGAARAAGYREEGVLRGYRRERDGRVDSAIMSLLPADLGS